MEYDDDFVQALKNNPISGTIQLLEDVFSKLTEGSMEWTSDEYDILLETYALVVELLEEEVLPIQFKSFNITGKISEDCGNIFSMLSHVKETCSSQFANLKLKTLRSRYKSSIGGGFFYEFSQGDLQRIQSLINDLRSVIAVTDGFEKEHRQRLLKRLEKLQTELHKKVSDLDAFWGLIGDAGVVIGKFGENAKPIVDCIREITDIIWRTQARTEELPSGTRPPMIEQSNQSDG